MIAFRSTLVLTVLVLAGCADDPFGAPDGGSEPLVRVTPGETGSDTTATAGFPASVSIVGVVYRAGSGVPTDTGAVSTEPPVPGVPVRFMRNVLRDGRAVQIEMGRVTSGADGRFAVAGLPGGYYVVEGLTPAGAVAAYELVATTQAVTRTAIWMPEP